MRLIYQGNAVRHVGATQMNDASSRSHSVFTLKIEQRTRTTTKGMIFYCFVLFRFSLISFSITYF